MICLQLRHVDAILTMVFQIEGLPGAGGCPPASYYERHFVEISIFVDESGEIGTESKYYLLTLLFHEQDKNINTALDLYEQTLLTKSLPDIPLHASPLMNGNDEYANLDIQKRKQLLQTFFVMLQHLPIMYKTFSYKKSEFESAEKLVSRMKRDIIDLMFDNLDYLHNFGLVKIYYDNGQTSVTNALHAAVEYAFSANAIVYREGAPREYRLSQAADLLCTLELSAIKYTNGEQSKTDERFFGGNQSFKKNWLKKIRKKLL